MGIGIVDRFIKRLEVKGITNGSKLDMPSFASKILVQVVAVSNSFCFASFIPSRVQQTRAPFKTGIRAYFYTRNHLLMTKATEKEARTNGQTTK